MKKILSIIIAIAICLSLAVTAMAISDEVTTVCPKCGKEPRNGLIWTNNIREKYIPNGYMEFTFKYSATVALFREAQDLQNTVVEKYFNGIECDELNISDYPEKIIEETLSGEYLHHYSMNLTLKDKSLENIKKVVSNFGCFDCSDFRSVIVMDEDGIFDDGVNYSYTLSDASTTLQYIAGWDVNVKFDFYISDVNGDDKVNLNDVSRMLKRIAGWSVL